MANVRLGGVFRSCLGSPGLGLIVVVACALPQHSSGAEPASAKTTSDEQVRRVLRRELAGQLDERGAALQPALDDAPNHAPARWQSGFVSWLVSSLKHVV